MVLSASRHLRHSQLTSLPAESVQVSSSVSTALWASLFFPQLPLEVLRSEINDTPWVVVFDLRGQQSVYAASAPAQARGVEVGMLFTAAYALCPELETAPRDEASEQACLTKLADWAGQYSSVVSLEPQALVVEIGASLTLFGGLQAMQVHMLQALHQLGHEAHLAIAPTPQAALLLARCGVEECVNEVDALRATLGKLPIAALQMTDKQAALSTRLGLRSLYDLWRLPRAGLATRFGVEFVDYLARLLGQQTEPRLAHQTAPTFSARWSFPLETDNMTFIMHGIEQLLPKLASFMCRRELALNRIWMVLYHPENLSSRIELGMQQLCRESQHMLNLFHERLNQTKLSAPVLELELIADEFHAFVPGSQTMFADDDEQDAEWQQLIDQLQTRLGSEAVRGLQLRDEHRPEQAWAYGDAHEVDVVHNRPLWLMPQPCLLRNGLKGIELLSEPERIESGWWDGCDIRRDYYFGRDGVGRRLWLFCDLTNNNWYVHGLFG